MNRVPESGRDQPLLERAERLMAQRDFAAARSAFESVVAQQPEHVVARLRLSTLATAQGRYREAVAQLLAIAGLQPADPQLLTLLSGMLHRLGESRAALACLEHPALQACQDKSLLEEAAQLASQMDAIDRVDAFLDGAEKLGGQSVVGMYTRATGQLFQGQLDQAEATLESCLRLAPGYAQAHWALSRVHRQSQQSNHVARLIGQLAGRTDDAGVPHLAFALFKELDDLGRTDEAWAALQAGCIAKRRRLDYRPQDDESMFAELFKLAASGLPAEDETQAGPMPIFIVGMPRTGTTLLERILSAHSQVQDAGELDDFPLQLRWIANRFSKSYLDAALIRAVPGDDFRQLGQRYLDHAGWRAHGKSFFTDKLPLNFLHVGLIAQALPGARILHMVRNPMDTCFSNLKELFADAYPYSYDLRELAAHYGRYRRLMAHWHQHFPGRMLDVSYEDLVSDPLSNGRRVMAFCGLDWQPGYAQVESNASAVTTASSVQVREPIHRRAVDGWRRYESQLEPLQSALRADGWLPA